MGPEGPFSRWSLDLAAKLAFFFLFEGAFEAELSYASEVHLSESLQEHLFIILPPTHTSLLWRATYFPFGGSADKPGASPPSLMPFLAPAHGRQSFPQP